MNRRSFAAAIIAIASIAFASGTASAQSTTPMRDDWASTPGFAKSSMYLSTPIHDDWAVTPGFASSAAYMSTPMRDDWAVTPGFAGLSLRLSSAGASV